MAQSITTDYTQVPSAVGSLPNTITITWQSAADGTCTGVLKNRSGNTDLQIRGVLKRVVFNPDAVAPTDNYDVTITDEDGIDVLSGLGANRDTANSEEVAPGVTFSDGSAVPAESATRLIPRVINGKLTLNITNAGDSKKGVIKLYLDDN